MAVDGLLMFDHHSIQPLDRLIDIVFTGIEYLMKKVNTKRTPPMPGNKMLHLWFLFMMELHAKFITFVNWHELKGWMNGQQLDWTEWVGKTHKRTMGPFNLMLFLPQSRTKESTKRERTKFEWMAKIQRTNRTTTSHLFCVLFSFGLFSAHFVFILSALGDVRCCCYYRFLLVH